MPHIKVSITVPVYNVEKYLRCCLDSLVGQTLKDIEIILVDDGSIDRSSQICDEYAAKDHRIRVIHKENGGLASARQIGLEHIRGEYYTVCDSDDWVEPEMYEELYNKAIEEDADIVLSDYYTNYPNSRQTKSPSYKFINQDQYILDVMSHKTVASTWCKLFRTHTIRRQNIKYEDGINLGEDALFLYKVLLSPVNISVVNKAFYHYRRDINSNSYTNSISLNTVSQNRYICEWKEKHFNHPTYNKHHIIATINLACTALRANDIDKESYYKITNQISIVNLLRYKIFTTKSLFVCLTKILGFKFGRVIYKCLYRFYYK